MVKSEEKKILLQRKFSASDSRIGVRGRPRAARSLHRQLKSHCPQDRSTMQALCSWCPFFCILFFGQAKKSMSEWLETILIETGIIKIRTEFSRRRTRAARNAVKCKW